MLSVAKTFLNYRKKDLGRIISDEGILLRINRSIQVEGSFGELKHDMQFRRFLCRGTTHVLTESTLLAMAKNLKKLHNKIQKGSTEKASVCIKKSIKLEKPKWKQNRVGITIHAFVVPRRAALTIKYF